MKSSWIDEDIKDEHHFIEVFFNRELKVWDSDGSGYREYYFAFDSGRCFKLHYDWSVLYEPEWEIIDDICIEEVSWEECKKHVSSNRDWLKV
jgi:hypothetical protein